MWQIKSVVKPIRSLANQFHMIMMETASQIPNLLRVFGEVLHVLFNELMQFYALIYIFDCGYPAVLH